MLTGTAIIRELKGIVGSAHVSTALEDLVCYSYDGTTASGMPETVVHPASSAEVAAITKLADAAGVNVIARGAGTGLSGGSVPQAGGIVLHLNRMNALKLLDRHEQIAVVEPGLTNWELRKAADAAGLFYPPDPSSGKACTLGGNVAENAGGPSSIKYGATGDYVLGLEAVTGSGEIIRTGGATRRNVAGYDLTRLLVGSEGTLAIATEITLKLLVRPEGRGTALLAFERTADAGAAVAALCALAMLPAAIDIMDATAIDCVQRYLPGRLPKAAAVLLVDVDGDCAGIEEQLRRVAAAAQESNGKLVRATSTVDEMEELWESRRIVSAALARMAPARIGEDVCVPRTRIHEMLDRLRQIGETRGVTIAVFGHAGDGVLHPNILTDPRDPQLMAKTQSAIADIFEAALALGGTLSGEHGIGVAKSVFMNRAASDEALALMKAIKQVFDPRGTLNPGKIF